jgi:phage N-6-adenine-methyltransferase
MATMPVQKPGRSKQDYGTPPEFLAAVKNRLRIGDFDIDLAATKENAVCPYYYSLEEGKDSLLQSWQTPEPESGWAWLNPPYADIQPWVHRAHKEAETGAHVAVLIPASVGANWWAECVDPYAYTVFLNGRLTFVGETTPYPKDCALLLYTPWGFKGSEVWNWRRDVPQLQPGEHGED